jgi:hypothetical protein
MEDWWEIVGGQPEMAVPLLREVPPTRVFRKKRLEVIENKGQEGGKEGKERGKRLQPADGKRVARKNATQRALSPEHRDHRGCHPGGFAWM